jgi:hypothetical protein
MKLHEWVWVYKMFCLSLHLLTKQSVTANSVFCCNFQSFLNGRWLMWLGRQRSRMLPPTQLPLSELHKSFLICYTDIHPKEGKCIICQNIGKSSTIDTAYLQNPNLITMYRFCSNTKGDIFAHCYYECVQNYWSLKLHKFFIKILHMPCNGYVNMLQMYSANLAQKAKELKKEKRISDTLLFQMLPPSVAQQLKQTQQVICDVSFQWL